MSIKTDCSSLDIAFYKWAATRLAYFVEVSDRHPLSIPHKYHTDEWADIITEMRDTFQDAADSEGTEYEMPSPSLQRALKLWVDNIQYLWN